jgi:3''-phosphoadenosine 5''-phosphosulfate sulfotransferase (PAPS reductase)/FAD synthetase and related enzymes
MLRLAQKAFHPGRLPFPLLARRYDLEVPGDDRVPRSYCREQGLDLKVWINPEGKAQNINPFDHGSKKHTDIMKTAALKQALNHYQFDAAFGGARRDEEKSRAKERVYSFRDRLHQWDPKNQRPELWNLYNGKVNKGESIRAFPLSNWTELDVWQYIHLETSHRAALLRRRPPGRRARRHAHHGGRRAHAAAARRGADDEAGAVPHAGLLPAHRGDRESTRRRCRRSSRRCCWRGTPSGRAG